MPFALAMLFVLFLAATASAQSVLDDKGRVYPCVPYESNCAFPSARTECACDIAADRRAMAARACRHGDLGGPRHFRGRHLLRELLPWLFSLICDPKAGGPGTGSARRPLNQGGKSCHFR